MSANAPRLLMVVQFLLLRISLALRRDSTEQELVRQVGTPSFGNSHCVKPTYATRKTIIQAQSGISILSLQEHGRFHHSDFVPAHRMRIPFPLVATRAYFCT
jgi:hypothetical protein